MAVVDRFLDSLRTQLDELCAEFADTEPGRLCSRADSAYANCFAASVAFARFLRDRDIACGLLHLTGSREPLVKAVGRWPYTDSSTAQHWVVSVGPWAVDWTARQFDPEAPLPFIADIEGLADHWVGVDEWACTSCDTLAADELHCQLVDGDLHDEHRRIALETGGAGPFPDLRHDTSAPLSPCAHHHRDFDDAVQTDEDTVPLSLLSSSMQHLSGDDTTPAAHLVVGPEADPVAHLVVGDEDDPGVHLLVDPADPDTPVEVELAGEEPMDIVHQAVEHGEDIEPDAV